MTVGRILRGLLGVLVVGALLFVLNGWWHDYRQARPSRGSTESSSTATGTPVPDRSTPAQGVAVAVIDGVNLRQQPDAASKSMRGLKKGERLTILAAQDSWYQVKDAAGKTGWVTSSSQYIRVEK